MANFPQVNNGAIDGEFFEFQIGLVLDDVKRWNQCLIMAMAHELPDLGWMDSLYLSLESGIFELPLGVKEVIQTDYMDLARDQQVQAIIDKGTAIAYSDYFEEAKDCLLSPLLDDVVVQISSTQTRAVISLPGVFLTEIEPVLVVFGESMWTKDNSFFVYEGAVHGREQGTLLLLSGHFEVAETPYRARVTVYKKPSVRQLEDRLYGLKGLLTVDCLKEKLFPQVLMDGNVAHVVVEDREGALVNATQRAAITEMYYCNPRHCYLLYGPPGTGKTSTGAELIGTIMRMSQDDPKILVCCHTNTACDTFATKLLESGALVDDGMVCRIYARSYDPSTIPLHLHRVSNHQNGQLVLSKRQLDKAKVIICTIGTSTNLDYFQLEYFSHILFDEASQIHELDALRPLSVFCSEKTKVYFLGDPEQLAPFVLGTALSKLGPYIIRPTIVRLAAHPFFRRSPHYMTTLVDNYRNRVRIGVIFSSLTYGGALQFWYQNTRLSFSPILDGQVQPVRWHICFGQEVRNAAGSVSNAAESAIVVGYVQRARDAGVEPRDIGIIAPYRAQVDLIKADLRAFFGVQYADQIMVDTVEGFQGREKILLILSMVRVQDVGFITRQRLNTSISRAMNMLIIVGNPFTFLQRNLGGHQSYAMRMLRWFKNFNLFHQDPVQRRPNITDYDCWVDAVQRAIPDRLEAEEGAGQDYGAEEDRILAFRTFLK